MINLPSGFRSVPLAPVSFPIEGTAPKNKLSGNAPVKEVAMVAVAMEPMGGMETVGIVSTDDTGDWVLVPDNITS